jgi:hypothetical protein
MRTRTPLLGVILLSATVCALPGAAMADCTDILKFLSDKAVGVTCINSADLRTNNAATTPPDNSIKTFADGTPLPGSVGALTPVTDRSVISNGPAPSPAAVPGIQVNGWFKDDPSHEARFLLRFPDNWNGKLVVAGASGTRGEFNGDFAWSDYVLSKGYAYASQNKGVLNFYLPSNGGADPLACRLNPSSTTYVHFYDNDAQKPFTQWTQYMVKATVLAQKALRMYYGRYPQRTYAVGTSNGGYQVRRALEAAPKLYDGGVDWEGTFIDPHGPNLLIDLPPAIRNFPDYGAAKFDSDSQAYKNIIAAGYPPDIVKTGVTPTDSLWKHYSDSFWEVTACQWQKRFDPTYDTYGSGLDKYDYLSRLNVSGVLSGVEAVETTGKIGRPLITVAGTMDALLPIDRGARAYEARVLAHKNGRDGKPRKSPAFRLYEVQNGNHIEAYVKLFPQLVVIQPHAQNAFDLLVNHVENHVPLPESQCIPKGGSISYSPAERGHCANLFVP